MLYATITEFGVGPTHARKVLDDLRNRARKLEESFPYKQYMINAFGNTDLVEVAFFNHYFRFAQTSGSSAQAFRRSVGVRCPEEKDLPPEHRENVCTAVQVLRGDTEGNGGEGGVRPFLAVVFMGLSPIPELCLSPGSEPLASRVFQGFCAKGKDKFWDSYHEALETSCSSLRESPEPLVAPLIGLDTVEVVLFVRAARLEQLAALGWAVRAQTLEDSWPAEKHGDALKRAEQLLSLRMPEKELERHWNHCPLYRGTTTVVGMRLREPDAKKSLWRVEELPEGGEEMVAAEAVAFLTHTKYLPGFVKPKPLWKEDLVGDPGSAPPADDAQYAFLLLFDRADVLWISGDRSQIWRSLTRRRTVREMREFLSDLSGLEGQPGNKGVWTSTEIAVLMSVPRYGPEEGPDGELPDRLRAQLHKRRDFHLQEEKGWTQRWLKATNRAGIHYSATNGVVNIISAVLSRIDNDLDEFADLLPALEHLVQAAEDEQIAPTDLFWLADVVERLAGSRSRRDRPLRLPRDTMAFESHAGHRLPREAFIAFAESLAEDIAAQDSFVVVQDTAESSVSCRVGPSHWDVLGVSALKLQDPLHWLVAHELAHGRFAHTTVKELGKPSLEALQKMTSQVGGGQPKRDENLELVFRQIAERLRQRHGESFTEPLAGAVARCLGEIAKDYFLWRSLELRKDFARDLRRRFWFVHGPGLVFALRHRYGSKTVYVATLQAILLRCILFSHLTESPASAKGAWWQFLHDTLEELEALAPEMRLDGPSHRWDSTPPPAVERWREATPPEEVRRVLTRLQCLKEDLRIPEGRWLFAVKRLLDSVRAAKENGQGLTELVDRWLVFVEAFLDDHVFVYRDPPAARELYAEYLSGLIESWQDTGDPWPPFVKSHREDDSLLKIHRRRSRFGPALLVRGSIFVESPDREGYRDYQRRTFRLLGELAERGRDRRFRKLLEYLFPDLGVVEQGEIVE